LRRDPLDGGRANAVAFFDVVVGNPPFLGKNGVLAHGEVYLEWLKVLHPGAHGSADLCAHFFRRADTLLGPHGAMGLVATNTIQQGVTRSTGLATILRAGGIIYDATVDLPWPAAAAAVTVSIVHIAIGSAKRHIGQVVLRTVNAG